MPCCSLHHCLCFLCLLPLAIAAQKSGNITLGSSLIAGTESSSSSSSSSSWVSPSGDFAFGFQQLVGTGGFLLAIWFNNMPEKTVTWSANNGRLAQSGSKLQLTEDGRLVLKDPTGVEMWTPPVRGAAYAAMLDTGNFVLADGKSDVIWQSFDSPTDTILPTQIVRSENALRSRVSETNYSSGRFQLRMQSDGNLVFYMMFSPSYMDQYLPAYEATATSGIDFQMVFNQSGSIYVATKDGSPKAVVLQEQTDQSLYYQRAILEFDGVLRKYVYPRSSSIALLMNWTVDGLRPQSICSRVGVGNPGVCGLNSICQIEDDQMQRPTCECLPGYVLLDQMDQMKGCKPNFTQQSCLEDTQRNNHQFQLEEMLSANLPDSPYETLTVTSEVPCHNSCLSDCYCAAVVFGSDRCWKMKFPLSNVWINQSGVSISSRAFIKVRIGNSTSDGYDQHCTTIQQRETNHRAVILIESVFLGSSVCINILLLTLVVFTASYCTYKKIATNRDDRDIAGTNMRSFSYKELEEATDGFKVVLGQGAFATVYKGLLDSEESNVIAVKKLNESVKENQREFESEVKAIARTGHRNLVQLIGFCNEGQHRLLVYEYMPNGCLADILLQVQRPNLSRRMKFALETARGLNYLHEECSLQIIHCDIKLQNILLDDSFTARISDFGIAKLLKKDQAHTITGIRGTKGYVAPEWFKNVPITSKVDVYSYGILLLELICCRRCFEAEMEDENQMVLADWAYDCYQEGRVDKLMEDDDEALAEIESIKKFVMIALWCIQDDPSLRPSMNKVVHMIKEALEETLPQDLALCISPMSMGSGNSQPSSTEVF